MKINTTAVTKGIQHTSIGSIPVAIIHLESFLNITYGMDKETWELVGEIMKWKNTEKETHELPKLLLESILLLGALTAISSPQKETRDEPEKKKKENDK